MASASAQAVGKDAQEHDHHHWCNDDVALPPLEDVPLVTLAASECVFAKERVQWPHMVTEPRRVHNKFEGAFWKRAPSNRNNIDILQDAHAELNRLSVIHEAAHFSRLCASERAELLAARMGTPPRGATPPARALSITILMSNVGNPSSVTDLLDAAAYLAATPGGCNKKSASHDARMSFVAGGNAGKYLSGVRATRQHLSGEGPLNTHADVHIAWAVRPKTALMDERDAKPIESRLCAIPYERSAFEYAKALLTIIRTVLSDSPNSPPSRLLESYGDMNYDSCDGLALPPGENVECAYEGSVIRTANRFFDLLSTNEAPLWTETTQTFLADGHKMNFTKMWARLVPQPKTETQPPEFRSPYVSFAALIHHTANEAYETYPGERACALVESMKTRQEKEEGQIFGLMPPTGDEHNVGLHAFMVLRTPTDIGAELSDYGVKSAPGHPFRWRGDDDTVVNRLVFRIVPIDDRLMRPFLVLPITHRNVRGMHSTHRNDLFQAFADAFYDYANYFREVANPNNRKRSRLETSDAPCTPELFQLDKRARVDWEKESQTARLMAMPFSNPGQRLGDIFAQLKRAGAAEELLQMVAAMANVSDHEATLLMGVQKATEWMMLGPKLERDQPGDGRAAQPQPNAAAPSPAPAGGRADASTQVYEQTIEYVAGKFGPDTTNMPWDPRSSCRAAPAGPLPASAETYELSSPALDRLMRDSMRIDDDEREEAPFDATFPQRRRRTFTSEKEDPIEAAAEIATLEAESDAARRAMLAEAKQKLRPVEAVLKRAFGADRDFLTDAMMAELHALGTSTAKMLHLLRAVRGEAEDVRTCSLIVSVPVAHQPKFATSFYNIPRVGEIVAERIDKVLNRCHERATPGLRILMWRQEPERVLFHLPRKLPV